MKRIMPEKEVDIESIFPVTIRVPLFAVWFTNRRNYNKCTGVKCLKKILKDNGISLGEYEYVEFLRDTGTITMDEGHYNIISSHDMVKVKPWTKVTLKCIFIPNLN